MHKCILYYWPHRFCFFFFCLWLSHVLSPSLSAWMTLILRVLCYWLALCWIFQPLCERAGRTGGVFWFPVFITALLHTEYCVQHTHTPHCECSAIHLILHKLFSSNNQLTQRTVIPYSACCFYFAAWIFCFIIYLIHTASWRLRQYIISFAATLIQWHRKNFQCFNSLSAKDI